MTFFFLVILVIGFIFKVKFYKLVIIKHLLIFFRFIFEVKFYKLVIIKHLLIFFQRVRLKEIFISMYAFFLLYLDF